MLHKVLVLALLFSISLCSHASFKFADYDAAWVELGVGFLDENISLNIRGEKAGWALKFSNFNDNLRSASASGHIASDRLVEVKPSFKTIGLTRLWSAPYAWGYADVGVGLGFGEGEWDESCKGELRLKINTSGGCVEEGSMFGIPLHGTVTVGKYIGMGLYFNAFLGSSKQFGSVGFVYSLGKFTK